MAAGGRCHEGRVLARTEAATVLSIHGGAGEIGHVKDFFVDENDWSIQRLVVDTKNWWPGKIVLIEPRSIKGIDWTDNLVNLKIDRKKVKESPAYDVTATIDQAMMETFP